MPASGLGYQIAKLAEDVRDIKDQLGTYMASSSNGEKPSHGIPSHHEARLRCLQVEPIAKDNHRWGPKPAEENDFHVSTTSR
jgi:hypothetical protein